MLTILKKLVLSTLVAGGLAFGSTPARADNYAAEITPAHFSITFGHRDYDDYAYQPYYAAPAYPAQPSYGNYYEQPYVQPYYAPRYYSRPSWGGGYYQGGGYGGGWGGNGWHNGWRRY